MNFEGIQAAIQATRNVHQVTVDRVTYDCSLSHTLEQVVENDPYLSHLWRAPLPTPPATSPRLSDPTSELSAGISSSPRSPAQPRARKTFSTESMYGNFSTDPIIPRNSSAENSLPSGLTDVESLLRDPGIPSATVRRHRPSETFSEVSVESLEALANLNISNSSRIFPYDLTIGPNPAMAINSVNSSIPYSPFGATTTTISNHESSGKGFMSFDSTKGFY